VAGKRRGELTTREREILGMLAEGLSGAEIAAKLVLSPETVRTHIRNAMAKLGASTRSQAVALAMQKEQIADPGDWAEPPPRSRPATERPARRIARSAVLDLALEGMLADLCSLPDVDGGVVLLAEEDGLTLRRAAVAESAKASAIPERTALGEGPLGRVALNRRAAVLGNLVSTPSRSGTALAAPLLAGGQLLGVLGLTTRTSRPAGHSELLVLQAFVNRIAEILQAGEGIDRRLETTVQRFSASWSAATS
jgi:DNA-binding CsgD family transcriptional regulator